MNVPSGCRVGHIVGTAAPDTMDDNLRLELIAEAVRYVQRAKAMGMPASAYTKALREPIHYLWERRSGRSKDNCAQFRSRDAVGRNRRDSRLCYDHAVPFKYLQDALSQLTE